MKMRVKGGAPKKECPQCKGHLEENKSDAIGAKANTHHYVVDECHVCGYRGKGRLIPKTDVKVMEA